MDRRRTGPLTAGLLLLAARGHAALEGNDPAPRLVRLAGSHPALPAGAQDFRGNPATAATGMDRWEAGGGITRPLGLEGLWEQAGWAMWTPAPVAPIGGGIRTGWREFRADDLYRDDALFASGAVRWRDLSLGAATSLLRCDYGDGDEGFASGISVGGMVRRQDLSFGVEATDPSLLLADPPWMREPWSATMGAALAPKGGAWRTAATAAYRQEAGWSWRLAQEAILPLGVDAGLGVGLEPFRLAGGIGWRLGPVRLDAAAEGDPVLGWQSHLSFSVLIR
jgi:hypothetical protein